uniref:Proline rich 12 n=1 Tax=Fundulus heteroclitus TaxID=8078 RepID=A0A3Q2QX27_FUNHE
MERNYPTAGFGDLGTGTGWSYDRSKASLIYGSSRSSHPDSELLRRQAYGPPHPLQGYATNHHPRQGLSGLFDTSLHHASTSGPDPAVMNLISALESRDQQPTPSASSLLSQFRTPSWQPTMHTPAPAELFISGAISSSGSFSSSSPISAYQHPGSFPGRSLTPSLSLQDTPTYSPTSNGLLSPHDALLHIKTPSQSNLGFDRLLSSQSVTFRGSQKPPGSQNQAPSDSSNCHLPSPQFSLLSSQLHSRSSELYNSSMFSSGPPLLGTAVPQPQPSPERAISRQDSVIKHYQRSPSAHSTSLQQYASCGGSSRYQQLVSQHQHTGMPCSPLDEQSSSSDPKPPLQMETQTYQPNIQTSYTTSSTSSSVSSSSATKGPNGSSSNSGYSSSGSLSSSSHTPHTPPLASSSSTSNSKTNSNSLSAPPLVSSTLVQQPAVKQCLPSYSSQSLVKSSTIMPNQSPPKSHSQSYSPTHGPSAHMAGTLGGFSSPHLQDLSSGGGVTEGKTFASIGSRGRSFSAEIVFGDSSYCSGSLRRANSPSLDYGNESTRMGPLSGLTTQRGGIGSIGSGTTSPAIISTLSHSALQSPAAGRPAQSPGSSGGTKCLSSILSPTFMSSPQNFPDTHQIQSDSYHSITTKPKTDAKLLPADGSRVEAEEADDFLIQHLLHTQRSAPHPSQHHSHSQQLSQCITQVRDGESKITFDNNKLSNECFHPQSVIRTNNTVSYPGPESTISETANGLNRPLESTQKKQLPKSELIVSKSPTREQQQQQQPLPQHNSQQKHSDLHNLLDEPELGASTLSHLHHLDPPPVHARSHTLQGQQAHTHQQLSHEQLGHAPPRRISGNMASPHNLQQTQQREQKTQLPHSQFDQLKRHQFGTISPANKFGLNQIQQQQRFPPVTSICFSDSLLQDEDRSFFPEMEDMFCSTEYKSNCAGDSGAGQAVQECLSKRHGQSQEDIEALKVGHAGEGYDVGNPHTDQGYGQYCHNLPGTGNGNLHLDLDSLKTHELPSTVNTDQLGLIQSQTPSMALGLEAQVDGSVNKMMGAMGGSSSNTGLTSPIFCSSRPKKLLKTSSFHLLKQRREPLPQTKKNYPQEYEFEDDEDKADVPADIRLNSRRLPDLLPDLVSSCRRATGATGLSPMMSDVDFCHPSSYTPLGHHSQILPLDAPKKRGRKPTKPKREGPPRPRGRPRIRPLPEPPHCRGLMSSAAGETRRGRGRGRGRESSLKTDSLSSSEPVLSEGSVGSAPSLGISPGPSSTMDADDKDFDFKPAFMASFLDFLKTGKKESDLAPGHDGGEQEALDSCSSLKGGIRPLSSPPPSLLPPTPQPPLETFTEDGKGEGADLALSDCSSPCKPLDEELKRNLETLPSFSSDEEDSVSKNQDLQESISSAISALYDTPHSLAAVMASAMIKTQPIPSPPTPQEPSLSPPLPAMLPVGPAPSLYHQASTAGTSPPPSTSPPAIPSSPLSSLPQSIPPPSTTPPPSSSDHDQDHEAGEPSPSSPSASSPSASSSEPPSPPTPDEPPASQRLTSLHLAKKQADAAIAGESDEEDSESGGEGIFRERDEFVVRTEDIGTLKMALQTGREPPPIWRVQKALLQKFSPEIKDGQRQFCATSNYLGYFGDAKMCYQRLYVKFLENVNKKDYVRVCSRKPWHRAERREYEQEQTEKEQMERRNREQREKEKQEQEWRERLRQEREQQEKRLKEREKGERKEIPKEERDRRERQSEQKEWERRDVERDKRQVNHGSIDILRAKEENRGGEENKTSKDRAEPPPKKRKKWLKEVPSSSSESDSSRPSEDEGQGSVNSRAMREMFRSYVEMLVSTALDPDMIQALEDTDDELYLPPMRKIDSLLSEQKKRLLRRVNMSAQHQEALHLYPKMSADPLEPGAVRVHLDGEGYSRKTLNRIKKSVPKQQDMKLSIETCRIYSLYHSLHHYKYHTFLHCKKETGNIEQAAEDPGQEEVVQQCMANQAWLESLFSSFIELLTLSAKA